MRTLTPDDIKRENAFRAAQRKAGKSRRGNMKDPNAPKKPLSAYFMFLQRIRADERLVREVFGGEGETTRQSVLAAARWRAMTDEERKVRPGLRFVHSLGSMLTRMHIAVPRSGRTGEARIRGRAQDLRGGHARVRARLGRRRYQLQRPPARRGRPVAGVLDVVLHDDERAGGGRGRGAVVGLETAREREEGGRRGGARRSEAGAVNTCLFSL